MVWHSVDIIWMHCELIRVVQREFSETRSPWTTPAVLASAWRSEKQRWHSGCKSKPSWWAAYDNCVASLRIAMVFLVSLGCFRSRQRSGIESFVIPELFGFVGTATKQISNGKEDVFSLVRMNLTWKCKRPHSGGTKGVVLLKQVQWPWNHVEYFSAMAGCVCDIETFFPISCVC